MASPVALSTTQPGVRRFDCTTIRIEVIDAAHLEAPGSRRSDCGLRAFRRHGADRHADPRFWTSSPVPAWVGDGEDTARCGMSRVDQSPQGAAFECRAGRVLERDLRGGFGAE